MLSVLYIFLAILGLSFLIFIHELGHYLMARRVGMRVDVFSIGFGRPIFSWTVNGVKWQVCWLVFGGYVKIAGMETEEGVDPYKMKNGYFSKSPLDRIKVLFMGPFVNIVFAFLAFILLWGIGGREKNFMEVTSKIGWVDPVSTLYEEGIRPGDEIVSYDGKTFSGFRDHLLVPITAHGEVAVEVRKRNYKTGEEQNLTLQVKPYDHPGSTDNEIKTLGILNPANYLLYERKSEGSENPLPKETPIAESGLQYGDRLVWADGSYLFSLKQLEETLNGNRVLLTIKRGDETLLRRTPRVPLEELKMPEEVKEEWNDWQFAAKLNSAKAKSLFAIPYNLTNDCVVENRLQLIDPDAEDEVFPKFAFSEIDRPLKEGDHIIAINGESVQYGYQLLSMLQENRVHLIVQRIPGDENVIPANRGDKAFDEHLDMDAIQTLASSIGTGKEIRNIGSYYLLNPIKPMMRRQFPSTDEQKQTYSLWLQENKKAIAAIADPELRRQKMEEFVRQENRLILGIPNILDRKVVVNPDPFQQFGALFEEISRTVYALFTGSLHPKFISGPIGIVYVVQERSMAGIKESIYWLGFISLNLGILNLLPIPVLDGGNIVIALFEMVTGRRLKPKTLEWIIIPFAILLIGLFLYLSYNDLFRLLS